MAAPTTDSQYIKYDKQMTNEQLLEPTPTEADKEKVKAIVDRTHKRGLDMEEAERLGLFNRISYLTCAASTLNHTAALLIDKIQVLFEMAGSNRHEVKRELDAFHKAYDRFANHFRGYQTSEGVKEMNKDIEDFYHQYMRWCNLPEQWNLGDKQTTEAETEPLIVIDNGDKELRFFKSVLESEDLSEEKEEYCVTKYNPGTHKQETVEDKGLDKSYAQMVAKRYSANDPDCIYTASKLITKELRITDIYPLKAYQDGELIGSYKKVFKSKK